MLRSPKIALITAKAARELDEDLAPLESALRNAGAYVDVAAWDDSTVDWSCYDLALLRSTWDYTTRLPDFLAWAQRVANMTKLHNPFEVVRWNTDKHYLRELFNAGVPVVPSFFLEPNDDPAFMPDHDEFVIKPAVGAGSRDAQRYIREEREPAFAHAARLLKEGRSVLVQPYLDNIDHYGETALIFFAGKFSHGIRKGPLLHRGQAPSRALFAAEHIAARIPSSDELEVAKRTLAAIPRVRGMDSRSPAQAASLLYARVDLIKDNKGKPCVLELELTEPSLFFAYDSGSTERFVTAILAALPQ